MKLSSKKVNRWNQDLLEMLGDLGEVTPGTAAMLRAYEKRWGISIFQALLETNLLEPSILADTMARELGIDRIYQVAHLQIAPEVLRQIPYDSAKTLECIALGPSVLRPGYAEVAIANPFDRKATEQIKGYFEGEIILAVAERNDILRAIDELYSLQDQLPGFFSAARGASLI